jgi:peptidoglycan/LPS O-acetylase OafA/YrhL
VADVSVKAGYRRSVDLARFFAAFGIVWDHARAPYADIGYTSLALFLVLTSFLAVGSFERSDGHRFWISRAQRIMLPWLVWCLFYRIVFEYMSHEPVKLVSDPWTLLIGPSVHLWFLPFVMIFLVTIPWVSRFIDRPVRLYLATVLLAIIAIPLGLMHAKLAPAAWFITEGHFPQPLPQWFFSLPLFWFGAILAAGKRMGLVWPVIAAAACISAVLWLRVPEFASVQMILTAILFEVIWRVNITGKWPTWLAGFAFGIYLLHPFTMLVAFKLFGSEVDRSFAALFGFALAWGITAALQRFPGINRFI